MPDVSDKRTDEELVAAINGGDEEAFTVLYHRYKEWVAGLALRFCGHHADAMDVLQETFVYLAGKFPGFQLTARMTTFLYPAVRNLSIAARKKRQRSTSGESDLCSLIQPQSDDTRNRDEFAEMLQGLSDDHREILLMRFVDGMTQPEIAVALGIALGTVKSRLHHAVHAVKNSPVVTRMLVDS